ncbi:MAG: DUF5685 family protein [Clostridiaceae bacterium]|nr:DUF5685 family protein [Clostridiaceae bacterium]
MFGYVQIRKPELKIKDYDVYHGTYCGLCSELKRLYGFPGRMTLTYDMTFLVLCLSSVYDISFQEKRERCIVHPGKKHLRLTNEITEYAAHLNMILTWYHLKDDRADERSKKAWLGIQIYQKRKRCAEEKYPAQAQEILEALNELSALEQAGEKNIFSLADCFGRLMSRLFLYRRDAFEETFRCMGHHLGRFIYLMDAYDDLEKDREKGCFNPLLAETERENFEGWIGEILLNEMAEAAAAYQKLPCLAYQDILGNILYAGVWNRYDAIQQQKKEALQQ